jgi:hypothetical protein
MQFRKFLVLVVASALTVLTLGEVSVAPAEAHQASTPAPAQGAIPSPVPSAITPQVDNGQVWSVAQVGNTLVMGGTFSSVGGQTHNNIAAFNATTGALIASFSPSTNDQVYSVLPGPDDHSVYVGGAFTQVNGVPAQFLTMLDTTTGAIVSSFKPPAFDYGMIRDMDKVGNRLYIGGFFGHVGNRTHGGIATLNATTGALDSFMNVQFAGHHNQSGSGAQGWIGPWALDISPDGTRLIVIGNFKTADGLLRDQVAMIDIDGASAVVDPNWATQRYSPLCFSWAFDGYVRGVSFSPDGTYFAINATGGGVAGTLCDATARFETNATGTNIQPTWVDETGGDTVWGVTVTDDAVFIGGHNRWNNNPLGSDRALPGAVPRPGLAALDPMSGRPFSWNPGHNPLGTAVYALLATPAGLWMGYDNQYIGDYKYLRKRIVFFPYAGGSTLPSTKTGTLPGSVYLGNFKSSGQTNVLYRIDTGGPAINSLDGGPDWMADNAASPSPYRNGQGNSADWDPVPHVNGSVPATTPSAIFDHEMWSPNDSPPLTYTLPVTPGTNVGVRLYFANRYTGTSQPGQRVFNVRINGNLVLDHYDIVADAGDQTGEMKVFNVQAPANGQITISLSHLVENPLINGIELIDNSLPVPPPPGDNLTSVGFDGTSASAPQTVTGTPVPWGQTRGAFMVGNKVFYGSTDGYLYSTTFDGSSFGTPVKVDPYNDPVWSDVDSHDGTTFRGAVPTLYSQLPNVTGMFYSGGRLYYTLNGDSRLFSRWFTPDSGIVDETTAISASSVNFSSADGMFVSGNTLYYVNKSNKSLYSVAFDNGTVSGTPVLVNGPATGGIDWTNQSLFFYGAPPANQPPVAAFSATCPDHGCSFDGSASADPDGSIASYSWDFGDGSQGNGVSPSHSYASGGTYSVTLTVTDNKGATGSVSHDVTVVDPPENPLAFVGASHSAPGSTTTKSVTIPSAAKAGDTALLVFTRATTASWTGPGAGWTQVDTTTNGTIASTLWTKTIGAGDPGSTVTMTNSTYAKAVLTLAVYTGTDGTAPIAASAHSADGGGTSHTTPSLTAGTGDWVVSFWTDKSAAVGQWTVGSGVVQRDTAIDNGSSGRYSELLADSGGPVAAGPSAGVTSTTDTSSDKAIMWTVALNPAMVQVPPQNQLSFVGASHSAPGSTTTKSVTVPATAKAGDTALLVFTRTASATWTGPGASWTQLDTRTNGTIASTLWMKRVEAGDPGSAVTMTNSAFAKAVLSLAVYTGTDLTSPVVAWANSADGGGTSHTTPSVTATNGDWVVSFWTDKSTAVSQWTPGGGVVSRDTAIDTGGSGRYSALVADSGAPVSAGAVGAVTSATDTASDKAIMWTVALAALIG